MVIANRGNPGERTIYISDSEREPRPGVETMISGWLTAKMERSGSAKTLRVYQDTISRFREYVMKNYTLDLNAPSGMIAPLARAWAASGGVGVNTVNHRLAVLSSAYSYWVAQGWMLTNPLERIKRARVVNREHTAPLTDEELARIDEIDIRIPRGLRDKALLLVALVTGHTLSQIAGLRGADVTFLQGGRVRLTFDGKAGRAVRSVLPADVGSLLGQWLEQRYGEGVRNLPADAPIWIGVRAGQESRPLTMRQLERICAARLGVGKFHSLRRTYTKMMAESGVM